MQVKAVKTFYNAGRFVNQGETLKLTDHEAKVLLNRELVERLDGQEGPTAAADRTLEEQTVTELRTVAKNLNVTGYYQMTKAELIENIRVAEEAAHRVIDEGGPL